MQELHWGLPVIAYLFLAGMGAGAFTVSSSVLLRGGGGGFRGDHFNIARYGALLAPIPLIAGTGMIIFELGTFQAAVAQGDIGLFFRYGTTIPIKVTDIAKSNPQLVISGNNSPRAIPKAVQSTQLLYIASPEPR